VFELGVGPRFIPRKKLTRDGLFAAISQALSDQTMRSKAAALGEQIHAEPDGVVRAVGLIEASLRREAPDESRVLCGPGQTVQRQV